MSSIYCMKIKIVIMSIKRNYVVGIIKDEDIDKVNEIIFQYAAVSKESSSHMYFVKQPINPNHIVFDVTFFQLQSKNENELNEKLNNLIKDLDSLNTDYVLRDEQSGELLVIVDFGGKLIVKFDKLETIHNGTFKKIDGLKALKTDIGYSKGFKPNFRPIEGNSIENMEVNPEIIYTISDSEENLSKLNEYISRKVLEIDSDFELEFVRF